MDVYLGLDLGQLTDFTAAAELERSLSIGERGWPERNSFGFPRYIFTCTAIRRYPLGTPYHEIVNHVVNQLKRPELQPSTRLVIDATGVGIGIEEMFRAALSASEVPCYAISITAGRGSSRVGPNRFHVSKMELVGATREALEAGRLKVPKELEHAATLARELQNFRVKITTASNETFEARSGMHDDLVLALALPVWLANQRPMEMYVDPDGPRPDQLPANAPHRLKVEAEERYALWLEENKFTRSQWERSRNPSAPQPGDPIDFNDPAHWT